MIWYIFISVFMMCLATQPRRARKPTKNVGTQTEPGVDQGTQTLLTDAMNVSDGDCSSDAFPFDLDVEFY